MAKMLIITRCSECHHTRLQTIEGSGIYCNLTKECLFFGKIPIGCPLPDSKQC